MSVSLLSVIARRLAEVLLRERFMRTPSPKSMKSRLPIKATNRLPPICCNIIVANLLIRFTSPPLVPLAAALLQSRSDAGEQFPVRMSVVVLAKPLLRPAGEGRCEILVPFLSRRAYRHAVYRLLRCFHCYRCLRG